MEKINLLYVVDVGRAVHENVVWQTHKDDAAKQARSRKTCGFLLFAALVSHSRLLSCKYHTHRLLLAKFLCLVIHIWVDRSRTRAPPLLMTPASNRQTHTSKLFTAASLAHIWLLLQRRTSAHVSHVPVEKPKRIYLEISFLRLNLVAWLLLFVVLVEVEICST